MKKQLFEVGFVMEVKVGGEDGMGEWDWYEENISDVVGDAMRDARFMKTESNLCCKYIRVRRTTLEEYFGTDDDDGKSHEEVV